MLESISCPSCSTHYGLRPERVRPGLRRAKCLRCPEVFDIEAAVAHLLASAEPVLEPASILEPAPILEAVPEPVFEALPEPVLEAPVLEPEEFAGLDFSLLEPLPEPKADAALSLSDLEGAEDEILDKTLLIEPPPPAEEPAAGGGFSSAKDAIAKLLGEAPAPAPERRASGRGGAMDVEATLDALEHTLGGTAKDVPPAPQEPVLGSTVRLSTAELQAAMAAAAPAMPAPPPAAPQAPTVAIPIPPPAPAPAVSSDSSLLKIQMEQETHQNVTLDQMTAWIEHGRVQEYHMVARQFSDNWIEAGKVPSLRPVFERVRRTSPAVPREVPPPPEAIPVKKGLFGWMSGR